MHFSFSALSFRPSSPLTELGEWQRENYGIETLRLGASGSIEAHDDLFVLIVERGQREPLSVCPPVQDSVTNRNVIEATECLS
jgi:hypothetical protein